MEEGGTWRDKSAEKQERQMSSRRETGKSSWRKEMRALEKQAEDTWTPDSGSPVTG